MSDQPTTTVSTSVFDSFISACRHGAALIYHDVVAAETTITKWRSDNPAVAGIFDQGVQYVNDVLTAHGIPVAEGVIVVKTIGAALKEMAAGDPSIATVTVVAPPAGGASA